MYVIPTERPDPPVSINVSSFGSRWAVLDWTPDFDGNKPIENYIIYWENLNTTTLNMTEERVEDLMQGTSSSSFMFNISSGIFPFTNYSFTVSACNDQGCSDNGVPVSVMTLQDCKLKCAYMLLDHTTYIPSITCTHSAHCASELQQLHNQLNCSCTAMAGAFHAKWNHLGLSN